MLSAYLSRLNKSSIQLEASFTQPCTPGRQSTYQKYKWAKPTKILFQTDQQGIPLANSQSQVVEQNDFIQLLFDELCHSFQQAGFHLVGLFFNADAGRETRRVRPGCEARESRLTLVTIRIISQLQKATSTLTIIV